MIFNELYRFLYIIKTILYYGLIDCIPQHKLNFLLQISNKFLLYGFNKKKQLLLGERLRLALQTLGPIWVKFGQMLSTRRDIFPEKITNQLSMLQNQVKPFDGIFAKQYIEKTLGTPLDTWCANFQETPLASASIAQVHSATLKKNNQEIVIKVIRPGIFKIIQVDIRLMYRLANWIYKILPNGRKFKLSTIILEYEKTLSNELNLLTEAANTIKLRKNFNTSNILYIPKVYIDHCHKNIMVMERIYGIPINDIATLKKKGANMKLLAERSIEIFFTQIFRDSFFHGDMHPGNIFINPIHLNNPKYISIDCGIVGSINKKNKHYLAANFIAFFNQDYQKIAELHLDSGWVPTDTNIEEFECAIRTVFEPIFEKPLANIPCSDVLIYLFNIARHFNMEIQPQLILIQKTLFYIEGIIRQIYPNLNLWKSAQPFLEKWMQEQLKPSKILHTLKDKIPYWIDKLPEIPTLLLKNYQYNHMSQKNIKNLVIELKTQRNNHIQILFLFGVGATLIISSIILFTQNFFTNIIPIILIIIGIYTWIIGWKYIQ